MPARVSLLGPLLALALAVAGCAASAADEPAMRAELEPGEALPGGDTTNSLLLGVNAFTRPLTNISREHETSFFTGNSFFSQNWVQAPASTTARDGLGPTFNARSCSGCHFKDGRGRPFDAEGDGLGLLLRLSVAGEGPHGEPLGDAIYGDQLQDGAIDDVPSEGKVVIEYADEPGHYADGEAFTLRRPRYTIEGAAFGELPDALLISPRIAPAMIGLGLLEALPESRLLEFEDEDDEDDDGISGRINRVFDHEQQAVSVGRFGWKAEQPSVTQQTAGALLGDMGISSRMFGVQNCPEGQTACADAADGGAPEIDDAIFDKLVLYARALAVPVRRDAGDMTVLRGKQLFGQAGCDGCHTPRHVTGDGPLPELSQQTIWPYTDLLLHDMGEGLSDERPSFAAAGSEWRTPPLWGLGFVHAVNGHLFLLHDGRARGFAEAILWHGGEARAAADAFRELSGDDRAALIRFLESL